MTHLYPSCDVQVWAYVDNSRLAQMKNDEDNHKHHNTMLQIHVFRELLLSFNV